MKQIILIKDANHVFLAFLLVDDHFPAFLLVYLWDINLQAIESLVILTPCNQKKHDFRHKIYQFYLF